MGEAKAPSGLRERKKQRTRQAIRRAAFRLFEENGYDATTVEHIAAAAEVSPSTVFRYFGSKEAVLLADDLSAVMLEALEAQPPGMEPLAAFRAAVHHAHDQMSAEEWEAEKTRQRLVYTLTELRPALREEYGRLVAAVGEAMARRSGRDAHDLAVQVFAGAVIGAVMALGQRGPFALENVDAAVDFLESGLRLE